MSDRAEELGDDESSDWRMKRALAAIDRSLEELVTRTERQAGGTAPAEAVESVDLVAIDAGELTDRTELADRPESELEADVARLQAELELVRGELSKRSNMRLEEAVGSVLERRTAVLERRLVAANERNAKLAERRVKVATEAAEARIAAAERAQEREESIRRRTEAARAEAEGRVRAAERRLVEVLTKLERADRGAIRAGGLED